MTECYALEHFLSENNQSWDKETRKPMRRTHVRRTTSPVLCQSSCIHNDEARIPPDSCRIFNPTANVACISKQSRCVLPFFFCLSSFLPFVVPPSFHRKAMMYRVVIGDNGIRINETFPRVLLITPEEFQCPALSAQIRIGCD